MSARYTNVRVAKSPSLYSRGLQDSFLDPAMISRRSDIDAMSTTFNRAFIEDELAGLFLNEAHLIATGFRLKGNLNRET